MRSVYLHGAAISRTWRDRSRSLTDLIYDCVRQALADAGRPAAELDAVVLSAHDLVDGRGLTNMVTAPAAAAYLKDETRLGDDGALAFVLGAARVRSGSVDTCLVTAWGRTSEGPVDEISHALFDPFTARPLALTELAVSGLRATRALREFPDYEASRVAAAVRRGERPAEPDRTPATAWPLRTAELPVWADVVAAIVLSSAPSPVRVGGVGASTEPYELGDRDLLALPALRTAGGQALRTAGVEAAAITVAELDGLTLFDEALAVEAVGLAPAGGGMAALASGELINPDGGSAAGYGAPAMGLVRVCRARDRLLAAGAGLALASGSSVVAAQTQAAVVLEAC